MSHEPREVEDRRGLRFPFNGEAEVALENPSRSVSARVTELSFRGCFLQISSGFEEHQRMRLKIYHAEECLEASGKVIYLRPDGAAVLFDELERQPLNVLRDWILDALDVQAEAERQQEK